ncbi:TPA: hypothetical protein ACH3X1_013104 [Trebouxia sp. C0004]
MHTIGNEVTAVTVMAQGGTAGIHSVARLPEVAKWEVSLNKRWEELLSPYLHGPYGKYLLEDCFHPEVQAVVFEYLDLLGLMWEKTIMDRHLKKLERIAHCADHDGNSSTSRGSWT